MRLCLLFLINALKIEITVRYYSGEFVSFNNIYLVALGGGDFYKMINLLKYKEFML